MTRLRRNSLCPCGSGKKYGDCCLAKQTEDEKLLKEQLGQGAEALQWLMEGKYRQEVGLAIVNGFYGAYGDMARVDACQRGRMQEILFSCLLEWLIGDAVLSLGGTIVPVSDLLLGPDGPSLTAEGRRYVEALAASRLALYEVVEGQEEKEGVLLRDMVRPDDAPVFVQDSLGLATSLQHVEAVGARILHRDDGTCTVGLGLYVFGREFGAALVNHILKDIRREARKKRPKATAQEIIGSAIISFWLDMNVEDLFDFDEMLDLESEPDEIAEMADPESELDEIVEASDPESDELFLFTTDTYRVSDWQALEKMLAAQDGVAREKEGVWKMSGPVHGNMHLLARLEHLSGDLLQVESSTLDRADSVMERLRLMAGSVITHVGRKTREIHRQPEAGRSAGEEPEEEGCGGEVTPVPSGQPEAGVSVGEEPEEEGCGSEVAPVPSGQPEAGRSSGEEPEEGGCGSEVPPVPSGQPEEGCSAGGEPVEERGGEVTPDMRRKVMDEFVRSFFGSWLTTPVAALKGKTPLEAARFKTYRPRIAVLLREFEQVEAQRVRESDTPAVDLGFLWERLGMKRG